MILNLLQGQNYSQSATAGSPAPAAAVTPATTGATSSTPARRVSSETVPAISPVLVRSEVEEAVDNIPVPENKVITRFELGINSILIFYLIRRKSKSSLRP